MNSTFNDHHHLKREPNDNSGLYPPSPSPMLKLNKDSHVIKKPPSPSSSSSAAAKPRQPVIIYTNTPKVIHTNPKDFMALVQKLTGMSHSEEDSAITDRGGKTINRSASDLTVDRKVNRTRCTGGGNGHNSYNNNRSYSGPGAGNNGKGIFFSNTTICEDSESSSVITTDENMGGGGGGGEHGHAYSAVAVSPFPHPPPPPPHQSMYDAATNGINYSSYFSTLLPVNPADSFLCGNQNFSSFDDPLYFMPNMRSSFSSSSSSGFDGLAEFRDF